MKRAKAKEQDYSASMPKYKRTVGGTVFTIFNAVFMIAFVVVTLYPVLNTLAVSFNDGTDALRGGFICGRENGPCRTTLPFFRRIT